MQDNPNLNDFLMVAAIAHTASLQAAAKVIGVNQATVFRRLDALEKRLGVRMFERQAGRYSLTLAGEEIARVGQLMETQAQESLRKVAGYDLRPSGEVRLTTTDTMAQYLLIPLLAGCRERHPGIRFQLQTSNQTFNLSKRDADIALRSTSAPPDHLIGKRIGNIAFAIYGGAAYCTHLPHQNWSAHPWLAVEENMEQHKTWRWLRQYASTDNLALRSNSFLVLKKACIEGLGLAVLPCFIADKSPELVRLSDPLPDCANELWLLSHADLRSTVRVKTILNDLHEHLSGLAPLLAGELGHSSI